MPTPRPGEKKPDYIRRCVPMVIREGTAKDGAQAAAICNSMWREHLKNNNETVPDEVINTFMNVNSRYTVQRVNFDGRPHLVVPVVMMVEGVHNGSHGPMYHSAEELGRYPEVWNGIPIVIHHPEDEDGNFLSANSPELVERRLVGRVFNTFMDGMKLRGECWLDEARLRTRSIESFNAIQEGRELEVSVGIFSDEEMREGEWRGEHYNSIAHNHRPDHLALLPGEQGACSLRDGCGIRANSEKGGEDTLDLIKALKTAVLSGIGVFVDKELTANAETGFRELLSAIQTKLDAMDDNIKVHFLEEVYKNRFIYSVRQRTPDGLGDSTMYQRNYKTNSDGSIEFDGEPAQVRRQVSYVTQQEGGPTNMAEGKKKPCCPGKVALLVKSPLNAYEEKDSEWLNELTEDQINKMVDTETMVSTNLEKAKETKPTMTKEQTIAAFKEQVAGMKPEEAIALFPPNVQGILNAGLTKYNEERKTLVDHIVANSDFKAEELENESMERLGRMAKMISPNMDFSLNSAGSKVIQDNSGGVAPMILATKKEAK